MLPLFQAELAQNAPTSTDATQAEAAKETLAERQARAAVALIRMGKANDVWPLLGHSPDPRVRSFIINWLKPLLADPIGDCSGTRAPELSRQPPAASRQPQDARYLVRFRHLDAAGADPGPGHLRCRRSICDRAGKDRKLLVDLYRNDPDSGVHGAAEWTLRHWKEQEKLKTKSAGPIPLKERGPRRWFINSQGQTLAIIDGPLEFKMGSPDSDPERNAAIEPRVPSHHSPGIRHRNQGSNGRAIPTGSPDRRSLQIGQGHRGTTEEIQPRYGRPVDRPDWYTAAAYCNWLSKREGLPEDQWCYQPNKDGSYAEGMTIPANVLKRRGYRLPTEAEWEYAARAGAVTSRYYGASVELLGNYAWYLPNSQDRAWPAASLLPNDLGLFDMLGNVYEWCQNPNIAPSRRKKAESKISSRSTSWFLISRVACLVADVSTPGHRKLDLRTDPLINRRIPTHSSASASPGLYLTDQAKVICFAFAEIANNLKLEFSGTPNWLVTPVGGETTIAICPPLANGFLPMILSVTESLEES